MIVALDRPRRAARVQGMAVDVATSAATWDAHVASMPEATIYHRWAWRRIFENAFGHRAHYLHVRRDGAITGGLPVVVFESRVSGRFGVSLPFVNYGGVVATDGESADALVAAGVEWVRRERLQYLELRHITARAPAWPSRRHKVAMHLPLHADAESQWASLDRKVRNQIRKAEKSGLTVEDGGASLVPEFHTVFARNMRDLGTPVYARRFFDEILHAFPDEARVFVVRHGRRPVAASITLTDRGTTEVPWASSLREMNDKAPNMLLYWAMLRLAIDRGSRRFDFGRSSPGAGTYRFKEQWGARPVPLVWEYAGLSGELPDLSPANPKYRLAIAVWQRLPLSITKVVGPHLVRHLP